jgi:2OG-Fe(II) oxygenase superfamily
MFQATRFATVLLYLNDDGLKGGETAFPRWLNGNTSDALEVNPKVGKAVLFYNQLPDGNYDERSQHAAKPVIEGEKWLVRTGLSPDVGYLVDHKIAALQPSSCALTLLIAVFVQYFVHFLLFYRSIKNFNVTCKTGSS